MSHTAYLRIKDKEYLLISCDYEFVQSMGWNGQPAGRPTSGLIHLILVSPDNEDTFFHDWLQDTMESKDGSIAFTADKAGIPLPKTLCFRDAYCIHLVEYFDGRLPMQMVTKITISAAEIDFCNKNVFKNIQPKNSSYVIAAGDNLSTIAKNHGVSVNQLAKWNNISDVNTIYAGDTLKVRESDSYSERGSVGMGKFDARPKWGVDKFDTRPILQSSKENWYDRKKAAKFDNRSYLERNPEMKKYFDVTDMVLTGISSVAGAKLSFSNYQYLSSLANNNKFLGMKYGKLVVMDNSYLSTKRMRLTLGHQKADFS